MSLELLESRCVLAGDGPPNVLSITRLDSNPTNQGQVRWQVLFDEAVQSNTVDVTDFALIRTGGLTGGNVLSVSGTGDTYIVSASTGANEGTLRLDLIDDNTIRDLSGDRLGGNGPGNGNFTNGQVYNLDRTGPTVLSATPLDFTYTNASSVRFAVDFSENVIGVDIADFMPTAFSTVVGASVTNVTGSGSSYIVTVNTGTGDGNLFISLVATPSITDSPGNAVQNSWPGGAGYILDRTAPTVQSVTLLEPNPNNLAQVRFQIAFSETVTSLGLSDFQLKATGLTGTAFTSLTVAENRIATLTANTGSGTGTLSVDVLSANLILDGAGNALASLVTGNPAYNIDRLPPNLQSIVRLDPSPTTAATVRFAVNFSEAVSGLSINSFSALTAGNLTGATIQNLSGSGANYTVTLGTGVGEGPLMLGYNMSVTDAAGNSRTLSGAAADAYSVDHLAPTVISLAPTQTGPTAAASVTFVLRFSEAVTGVNLADIEVIGLGGASGTPNSVYTSDSIQYFIDVNTGPGDGQLRLKLLDDDSIVDIVNRPLAGPGLGNGEFTSASGVTIKKSVDIVGTIWDDTNSDGALDAGEARLSGVTVYLDLNRNQVWDSAIEPAQTTGASGNYAFANRPAGSYLVTAIAPSSFQQTFPAVGGPGRLTWRSAVTVANGQTQSAAITSNNQFVFVGNTNRIHTYQLDPATGQLSGSLSQIIDAGLTDMVIASDNRFLYTTNSTFSSLYVHPINASTGAVTTLATFTNGSNGVSGLASARSVELSPNGLHLYVAGQGLAQFSRNATTGALTFLRSIVTTANFTDVKVSPDNAYLYVADTLGQIRVYRIDAATQALTLHQTVIQLSGSIPLLANLLSLAVSADGKDIYGATADGHSIVRFTRQSDGTLTYVNQYSSDVNGLQFLTGVASIELSPDGKRLFAIGAGRTAVVVLQRDLVTGDLTLGEHFREASGTPYTTLSDLRDIVVSPDGRYVLASAAQDGALNVFESGLGFPQAIPRDLTATEGANAVVNFGMADLPPSASIALTSPSPSAQSSASFTVQFSEPVTGVDVTDFSLQSTGLTAATISSVTGAGSQYTVSVSNITGSGTLALRLNDDDTIIDGTSKPLLGVGTAQGVAISTPTLVVDQTPPTASWLIATDPSISRAASVTFRLAFSETITGIDTTDFQVDMTGGLTGASVSNVSFAAGVYTVTVLTGSSNGTLRLKLVDNDSIIDGVGLPLGGAGQGNGELLSTNGYLLENAAESSLTGRLFHDTNQNLARDLGEPLLSNWTVYLDTNQNGQWNVGEPTTTTAVDGSYTFTGLFSGQYTVAEVVPAQWEQNSPGPATYPIRRISVSETGAEGSASSDAPSISADGRYVAFQSSASLVPGDTTTSDIFVYDRVTGSLSKISQGIGGALANGGSFGPAISNDGRLVAYTSSATNLVSDDTNLVVDVFVYDRQTQTTTLVSRGPNGVLGNGSSDGGVDISGDGRFVTFQSMANNFTSTDPNGFSDIYVIDLQNSDFATRVQLVSKGTNGLAGNAASTRPMINDDGSQIVFESVASNLVSNDSNAASDIFVTNRSTSNVRRISQTAAGAQVTGGSQGAAISGDGRLAAFWSNATNLVAGDSNGLADVFVVDLQTNAVELVSRTGAGQSAGGVGRPLLSTTGRYVGFTSTSSLLSNSGVNDVFWQDRATNTLRRVSQTLVGGASGGASNFFGMSDDGRFVAFGSDAKHLINGDNNLVRDCFLVDLSAPWLPNTHAVTLGISQAMVGLDFGNRPWIGEAKGTSWQDTSRDGVRAANEPGLSGRQIFVDLDGDGLLDSNEPSTITANDGSYRLSPIPTGQQQIRQALPVNWIPTAPTPPLHTRTIGERSVQLNFEELGTLIASQLYASYERDVFVFSTTSSSVSQWRFEVPTGSNTNELLAVSTSAGQHLMRKDYRPFSITSLSVRTTASVSVQFVGELQDGSTIVQAVLLAAGKTTVNLSNFTNLRSLRWSSNTAIYLDDFALQTTDYDYAGLNFGSMSLPGQIQGSLYHDTDQDGTRDAGELPISGRLVYIDANNDGVWNASELNVTSDASGNFVFANIDAGTYQVRQRLPAGWSQTEPAGSISVDLEPNQTISNLIFGSRGAPASIQGSKWNDLNANGQRDANEPSLAGWTIYLDLNNNAFLDAGEPSTITLSDNPATTDVNEAGSYEFLNLAPLSYVVRDVPQSDWQTTSPLAMPRNLQGVLATGISAPTFQHHPDHDHFVSGNGRYVVYTTSQSLLPQDLNTNFDVYLYDRQLNTHELISIGLNGIAPSAHSLQPSISDDGRYVAFRSFGTTLTSHSVSAGIVNIYVRDRQTQTTQLITTGTTSPANNYSYEPMISGDGSTLVFLSWASNLVTDDTDNLPDFFIKDLVGGQLTRVEASAVVPTMPISETWGGDVSGNGRYIAFQAISQGLSQIFWLDRSTGNIRLVSTSSVGVLGNGQSEKCAISGDGRFVVFDSSSTNLVADLVITGYNVYLKDMITGEIRILSRTSNGGAAGGSRRPDISQDGRWITFESTSQIMFADSANSPSQIVLYDRLTGTLSRLSDKDGTKGNNPSVNATISSDGRTIAFQGTATNLGFGGTGLFLIDRTVDPGVSQPIQVSLTAGVATGAADFGATQATASVAGIEFEDINRNGQQDTGEAAIAGAIIYIDLNQNGSRDSGEPTSTTASDGSYSFSNLVAGTYKIRAELPGDRVATIPGTTRHRLFGVYGTTSVTLAEMSPQTGATLSLTNLALTGTGMSGAAFDGTHVLLLSSSQSSLLKIAPSGNYSRIPLNYTFLSGLAYQNGLAYFIAIINSWPHLIAYDVNLGQAVRTLPITHSQDGYGSDPFPNLGNGLGEAPDGNGLVVTATGIAAGDPRMMRIDTNTGRITQYVATGLPDNLGAAGVGGEFFVSGTGIVRVLNSAMQTDRRISTPQTYYALAGGATIDYARTVSVLAGQTITGLNFGQRSVSSAVSGQLFDDRNDNRQWDSGEPSLSGVTVYVDANANHRLDAGETAIQSDASGRYTLSNVNTGEAIVRVVPLPGMEVNSPSQTEARMFATRIAGGIGRILEMDLVTGAVKNQFNPPPGTSISAFTGLAFDGTDLYFIESATNRLYALDPANGNVRRSLLLTGGGYDGLASLNGQIYVQDRVNNTILEIDRQLTSVLRTLDINQLNPNYLGAGVVLDLQGGLGETADGTRLIIQTLNNSASYLLNPTTGLIEGQWGNQPYVALSGTGVEVMAALNGNIMLQALNPQAEVVRRTNVITETIFGLAAAPVNSRGARVNVVRGQDVTSLIISLHDTSVPTAITFSATSITENRGPGSVVATLATVDANGVDAHQYSLVTGPGSDDNALFEIVGNQLRARQAFDFETRTSHSIRVRSTDASGNAFETAQTISVVNLPEVAGPIQVGSGSLQRSTVDQLIIQLDGAVDIDAGAFTVQKREYDAQAALILQNVDIATSVTVMPGGNTQVIITFSGPYVRVTLTAPASGALVDGNYQLTIDATKIRLAGSSTQLDGDRDGVAGGNFVLGTQAADKFFALYGDGDGDRAVGIADFGRFRATFGKSKGEVGYDAAFDYDGNDAVGIADFGQFRSRFGKTLGF